MQFLCQLTLKFNLQKLSISEHQKTHFNMLKIKCLFFAQKNAQIFSIAQLFNAMVFEHYNLYYLIS